MNTRKLIFGLLACLTLVCSTVAPYSTIGDDTEIGLKKKRGAISKR